jgi:hypothetical protein
MNELSVFADESGNFDFNKHHSRYYIVSLVFHDQSIDITKNIRVLNDKTKHLGQSDSCFHAGPLIRREDEYQYMSVEDRVRIFNAFYNFTRTVDVKYHAIVVDKNVYKNKTTLILQILKRLSQFLDAHIEMFDKYDRVIVYYDNGQREIKEMLATAFDKALNNAEFRNVTPNDYKLFQTADMICTLELLSTKAEHNKKFSNSEIKFFISPKKFDKDYYRAIKRKMIQ